MKLTDKNSERISKNQQWGTKIREPIKIVENGTYKEKYDGLINIWKHIEMHSDINTTITSTL